VLRVRFDEDGWRVVGNAESVLQRKAVRYELKGMRIDGQVVLIRLHQARLEKGRHTITIEVKPRGDSSVFAAADAFLLGDSQFAPANLGKTQLGVENSSLMAAIPVDITVYPDRLVETDMRHPNRGVALYSLGNPATRALVSLHMKRIGVDFTRFFLYHSSVFPIPKIADSPYAERLAKFARERRLPSFSELLERARSGSLDLRRSEAAKQIAQFIKQQHITFDNPGAPRWASTDALYRALRGYGGLTVLTHSDRVPIWLSANPVDHQIVQAGANNVLAAFSYSPNNLKAYRNIWSQCAKHLADEFPNLVQYLEIHNEPDLEEFLRLQTSSAKGSRDYEKEKIRVYLQMYEAAARGIMASNAKVKVGGPSLSGGEPKYDWIESLVRHCTEKNLPLDFISWHMYSKQPIEVRNAILKVKEILGRYGRQNAELIIDEWNVDGAGGTNDYQRRLFNSNFNAALSTAILAAMHRAGLHRAVFFYDRDQTSGVSFGLLTENGQKKPVYFAFQLFSMLGAQEIQTAQTSCYKVGSLATLTGNGEIALLVWNYDPSEKVSRDVRVRVHGSEGLGRFRVYAIDASHSVLGGREVALTENGGGSCEFRLGPNSVRLVQLRPVQQ